MGNSGLPGQGAGRPRPVAKREANSSRIGDRRRLFFHIIAGALARKRSRLVLALTSVGIGAAVVSGMSSVYFDIASKMSKELRSYGANIVVLPSARSDSADSFSQRAFDKMIASVPREKLMGAAPYLYGVAEAVAGRKSQRLVVAGTDFAEAKRVSPYWRITGRLPGDGGSALVGVEVAEKLDLEVGDPISFTATRDLGTGKTEAPPCISCHIDAYTSPKMAALKNADLSECTSCHQPHPLVVRSDSTMTVAGIISTGGTEDSQVIVDLKGARELFKKDGRVSAAYLSVLGQTAEIERLASSIRSTNRSLAPQLIKRISESEGQIIYKVGSLLYLIVGAILFFTALTVGITTVAMTLERRREIGLKKALGAEDRSIIAEFIGEGVLLGLIGGAIGWAAGFLFAQWIGQSVFRSAIAFRIATVPLTLLVSLAVTSLAAFAPVRIAAGINPATVLKEE